MIRGERNPEVGEDGERENTQGNEKKEKKRERIPKKLRL